MLTFGAAVGLHAEAPCQSTPSLKPLDPKPRAPKPRTLTAQIHSASQFRLAGAPTV